MQALARAGATTRLVELQQEMADLLAAFPALDGASASRRRGPRRVATPESDTRNGKRKSMSAAARKAVGERMKAYWRKRKGSDAAPTAAIAEPTTEPTVKRRTMSAEARARISAAQKRRWRAQKRRKR